MSTVRVRSNRQVTIPEHLIERMDLGAGDMLEAEIEDGKLVLTPRLPAEAFSTTDQKHLRQARRKITRIRKNPARSRGLTAAEAAVAARAGLIQSDQRWWWTEAWQSGERQVERELKAGSVKVFDTAEQLLEDLRTR